MILTIISTVQRATTTATLCAATMTSLDSTSSCGVSMVSSESSSLFLSSAVWSDAEDSNRWWWVWKVVCQAKLSFTILASNSPIKSTSRRDTNSQCKWVINSQCKWVINSSRSFTDLTLLTFKLIDNKKHHKLNKYNFSFKRIKCKLF